MPDKLYYVYIIQCFKGAYYTGIALDPEARLKQHNSGKGAKAVKALGLPAKIVYFKLVGSKSDALKREYAIKQMTRAQKKKLIEENASS